VKTLWSATLTLLVVCVLWVNWQQYRTLQAMERRIELAMQPADELIETYISGGQPIEVVTRRQPGETKPHWEARHLDDIKARWATSPPDG